MQILIALDTVDWMACNKVLVQTSDGMKVIGYVEQIVREHVLNRTVRLRVDMVLQDFAYSIYDDVTPAPQAIAQQTKELTHESTKETLAD
jgi:hypothetical protein